MPSSEQTWIPTPAPEPARPGRVLVVDDSRTIRKIVTGYLRSAGHDVAEAGDGLAALALLRDSVFDVVVSDLAMPELDGFGLLEAVKGIPDGPEVILLTGTHAHDMQSAIRALRLGAHDYLTKPPTGADQVQIAVNRAMEKKLLRDANRRLLRELEALTRTDPLTGLANRRVLDESLAHEVARGQRHGYPVALLMLDIDHFKRVNDTYGHAGGDEVLRGFGRHVMRSVRQTDLICRYGGEEFAIVLPYTDTAGAVETANRIVEELRTASIPFGGAELRITCSVGVASTDRNRDIGADELLAQADAALYGAKRAGRNRVAAVAEAETAHAPPALEHAAA